MAKTGPTHLAKMPVSTERPFSEARTSSAVSPGWRPLFGNFRAAGLSFEWHDFQTAEDLDWAQSFHPGSLELCLNLSGQAFLAAGQHRVNLPPRTSAFYYQGTPQLVATRYATESHRFITVEFSADFLKAHLENEMGCLHRCVQAVVSPSPGQSIVTAPQPMGVALLDLVESLQRCPVSKPAQNLWFRSKALELASQLLFCPPEGELFCTRQQRAACQRAGRVREILTERLADPPSLDELGKLVGCSPFYLSRQFSEAMGFTIPQFIRQARLERAADLLRTGEYNVTEAAFEVGYSSLSHFTVAFREVFGCCPGLYPLKALAHRSSAVPRETPDH